MPDPVDYGDPCAVLAVLRPAYYALLGGSQAQEVEFRSGNGTARRIRYSSANIAALKAEIADLEIKCASRGGQRRRHVIIAG